MRVPVASQPHQPLVVSVFWILAILIGVYWYLTVLSCISLMTYDVEPLLYPFLAKNPQNFKHCYSGSCVSSLVIKSCLMATVRAVLLAVSFVALQNILFVYYLKIFTNQNYTTDNI